MNDKIKFRKTKIWKDSQWLEYNFRDLKKGDVFRLFESYSNQVVKDKHGYSSFEATSDLWINDKSVACIEAKGIR
jgi:hypothetical protein